MVEDILRTYKNAKDELDTAYAKVQAIKKVIVEVGKALDKPYAFMVSNSSTGFPAEVALVRGIPGLNGSKWPSATQITEALSTLHDKSHQVDNIWQSLPEADKKVVQAPPPK